MTKSTASTATVTSAESSGIVMGSKGTKGISHGHGDGPETESDIVQVKTKAMLARDARRAKATGGGHK